MYANSRRWNMQTCADVSSNAHFRVHLYQYHRTILRFGHGRMLLWIRKRYMRNRVCVLQNDLRCHFNANKSSNTQTTNPNPNTRSILFLQCSRELCIWLYANAHRWNMQTCADSNP